MVAHTRQGNTPILSKKLQFKDKLIVKGSTTDALLKKLLTLQTELASLEQEHVDIKSLASIRKELIQVTILLHKDKGVKAYAACCLADLLRLYAPDAPYTADELRDIFQFFFRQLSTGLKGPEAPYYNQYFQLLESLSTVKSIVLLCDLPQADDLMTEVSRELFSLVQNNLSKNVELYMADILIALIDECQAVPHSVTELIMTQFANVDHPTASYRLAVEVCKATSDKLQRNVCQYFTDIIVQHSKQEEVLSEIQAAHLIIKQIHKDCPSLLHNVIPQLEEELKVDQPELRLLATQILGDMFADKNGVEMVKKYPHVWDTWQLRKLDKVAAVRVSFVDSCKGLIIHQPDLRESVEDTLRVKLLDPDDKVRAATCKLYAQLDETTLRRVNISQLKAISERTLDKKVNVRLDAMQTLGKLYNNGKSAIEGNDEATIAQLAWIPNALLHAAHANTENMTLVEGIFWEYILPLPSKAEDEAIWTDQLVAVMKYSDDRAINMLLNMSNMKQSRPTLYEKFVDFCEKYNGGIIDNDEVGVTKRLNAIIQHLSSQFSDRTKAAEDLHAFAKVNENRLYRLLKACMDSQVDLRTLIKTSNEFLRRIEQISSSMVSTMTTILYKATLWVINASSIPSLLGRIKQADSSASDSSSVIGECSKIKMVLLTASKYCPNIFGPHIEDLKRSLEIEASAIVTEVTFRALIALGTKIDKEWAHCTSCRPSPNLVVRTRSLIIKYSQSAHGKLAKLSARLIAHWKDAEAVASNLVISMSEALSEVDPPTLVGHLAFLAEIVKEVPNAFEQRSDTIVSFIVQDLLMRPVPIDPNAMLIEETDEWASDEEVSDLIIAKTIGVKICRNRCLVHANSETALANASPVFIMLYNILVNGGSMEVDTTDNPKVKSRIRLIAATSLLKMAVVPKFCDRIMPNFTLLAITLQDTCYQVRYNFLTKLVSYLSTNKTDLRFCIAVFLTVHDPEKEVKDRARAYVLLATNRQPAEQRLALFELNFLRLIYVLAHHPDFSIEAQNLKETAKYIEFYLDNIATSENISLLYHLTMKAKMVRDADPEFTENLYCVSELAQGLIRNRAKLRNWQLNSYTRKVKVPSDIFKPLENSEAVNANLKKTYLPGDVSVWLQEPSKATRPANVKPRIRESNRKRKPSTIANAKQVNQIFSRIVLTFSMLRSQRKKRRKSYEDDAEDNNDSDDSIEEIDESNNSDAEMSGVDETNAASSDVSEQNPKNELGRGARGRAKKFAEHAARKQKRERK